MAPDGELIATALKTAEPFSVLSPDERDGLAQRCRVVRLAPHELLLSDGDDVRDAFVLMEGQLVRTLMSYDGNRVIVNNSLPVRAFALTAAFENEVHIGFIEANCDAVVVAVPADDIHGLFLANPVFAEQVGHALARSSLRQTAAIRELMFPVPVRVARYLCSGMGAARRVYLSSKAELAAMMATRPETLSRAFATLREKGFVQMDGHAVTVLDPDALRRYACL